MSFAVLAARATSPIDIRGSEFIATSYPAFRDHYTALGGLLTDLTTVAEAGA